MIVKKLKRASFTKPKAAMIGGLVDYILASHDEEGRDKLAFAGSKNFLTTTVAAQKKEMISLAEESIQSRMPVTHWILSWQENEQPSREQVDEAVRLFLRGMGLAEHQTLYALHKNTGNCHLHIVVNRTHPYTQKVIQPHRGFDIDAAHKIIAEIEYKQGWASQMNARYRVNEQGYVVKNLRHREHQSRSVMCAGRNGWSIRRSGRDWPKKDASPKRDRKKNGKSWNSGSGSAGRLPQPVLPGTGFPC